MANRLGGPSSGSNPPPNLVNTPDTPVVSDSVSAEALELSRRLLERVGNTDIKLGANPSSLRVQNFSRLIHRYQELGMWNLAAREIQKLVTAQPGNARWHLMKGRIHARLARVQRDHRQIALDALRTAQEFPQTSRQARLLLGMLHGFQLGNSDRARTLLEGLVSDELKNDPIEVQSRFALSKLHFQTGRIIEAARVLQPMVEVASLDERHRVDALRNLGQLHQRLGNPDTARQYLRRAYKLQPWNSEIRTLLSRLGERPLDRYRRFE